MKRYVITGGTSGIGEGLVRSFEKDDVELILPVRNTEKALDMYKHTCFFNKLQIFKLDLEDVTSIKSAFASVKNIDKIDGFIHCAGIIDLKNLQKTTYEKFLRLMNINFFSFVEILRLLISSKKIDTRFRCVAMSSADSFRADRANHMYCVSKASMDAFIKTISLELNQKNVEINSIQPAFVNTPMADHQKLFHGDNFENWIREIQPLGLIQINEIVEMIRFYLEKKGSKITGTSVYVNSGVV